MGILDNLFGAKTNLTTTKLAASDSQASSLQQYWSALEIVDTRYRELVEAEADLLWYQGKMQAADELLKGEKFERTSAIKLDRSTLPTSFSRKLMESAVKQCSQLKESLLRLRDDSSDKLRVLSGDLERLKNNLTDSSNQISELTRRIDSMKTALMIDVIILIGVGIASAWFTGHLIATFVITGALLHKREVAGGKDMVSFSYHTKTCHEHSIPHPQLV